MKPLKPLEPPDSHHLSAAQGWLGLDNLLEAVLELEKIEAGLRKHPDVLEVRWQMCAKEERWNECLKLADLLMEAAPEHPATWICKSYALRRAPGGGLKAAQKCLVEGHATCPGEPIIAYNLACYACQLGDLKEARKWLKEARQLSSRELINKMALKDVDLKPLWVEIGEL